MRRYDAFRANLVGYLQEAVAIFGFGRVAGKDDKRAVAFSFNAKESSRIKSRGLAQFAKLAFEFARLA